MPAPRVSGIRSVTLEVTDLEPAENFFSGPMGLDVVARRRGAAFLRGSGRLHHVVELRTGPRRAVRRVNFAAPDRPSVDAIHDRVRAADLVCQRPHEVDLPGGGWGFGFRDPEGRSFAVIAETADHANPLDRPDAPTKITHVNLNAIDKETTTRVLVDCLGFRLIDETAVNRFFCCGSDHHSVVVGSHGIATLNHVAFEMAGLDAVMRGAGRMRAAGHPIEWGVGRHGPGNNVFAYFIGPEDLPLEFTAEVLQVDETYVPRGPADWQWPPGRFDQWGISDPQSARWRSIQSLTSFAANGWRLSG